jgi:hypothetical protein
VFTVDGDNILADMFQGFEIAPTMFPFDHALQGLPALP